ncbi:MAG: M15 family metallopeptidase [Angustibacter sp.]
MGLVGVGAAFAHSSPSEGSFNDAADTATQSLIVDPAIDRPVTGKATGASAVVQAASGLPSRDGGLLRMRGVSRSSERGPISGCSGKPSTRSFANGQIPESELCALPFASGHMLRADAAVRLIRLNQVYRGVFGDDLCITDSYRSLQSQYSLAARKPGLAARPGTSEHGWGLAIDLCGAVIQGNTRERAWFLANAPDFGWEWPDWARSSKYEPWHFEFFEGQ